MRRFGITIPPATVRLRANEQLKLECKNVPVEQLQPEDVVLIPDRTVSSLFASPSYTSTPYGVKSIEAIPPKNKETQQTSIFMTLEGYNPPNALFRTTVYSPKTPITRVSIKAAPIHQPQKKTLAVDNSST